MNSTFDKQDEADALQDVMGDYFAALLRETTEQTAQTVVVKIETPVIDTTVPETIPEVVAEPEPHSVVPQVEATAPAVVAEVTPFVAEQADSQESVLAVNDEQLATAPVVTVVAMPAEEHGYQLIRIGGLTLGIPTQAIAEVVTATAPWTPASDTRAWVLGSYKIGSEIYTVVDTAALLVPGSSLQTSTAEKCAVLLAGHGWALACDGIGERITPDPAQVSWRGAQGKRLWLAGTVREPSCALLDIPELLRLLTA